MNNVLRTTLIVLAVLVLAGLIFTAGFMYANAYNFGAGRMMGNNDNYEYGPGMMNRRGDNGYGPGMMGFGMKGGGGYGSNTNVAPLSIDQAKTAAESYLKTLGVDGLQVSEVMVFDNNAYVVVKETGTGNGAFELLVDPASQTAYPEFGPNMMWNLKYGGVNHSQMMGGRNGMMGNGNGMMGGRNITIPSDVSAEMSITPEKAIEYAQEYLDANIKGAIAATDPIQFYGYYTLDFEKDGKVAGMLSVNGYNGQVFLHTWHGNFIEEAEIQ